jgi:AcrR family transcriptional regulator
MSSGSTPATRSPSPPSAAVLRADAARNRERIIAAATDVFAERGLDASTAEIAERAGVGEATLFRRFASKDDLIDAICETRMDEMIAFAERAREDPDPERGLERLLHRLIGNFSKDQGFFEAAGNRCATSPRFHDHRRRTLDAMGRLLRRAQEVGAVRDDLAPQDLSFLIGAAAYTVMAPHTGLHEDLWKRYLRVILDGMRPDGASKLRPGAPSRRVVEGPAP